MCKETYSYGIDFINDEKLERIVGKFAKRISGKKKQDPYRNIIDPFSAAIESTQLNISVEQWINDVEIPRQRNKSIGNALGEMHQELIGALPGWKSLGNSEIVDLVHPEPFGSQMKPVVAEVKNKFNTTNSSSAGKLHSNFKEALKWTYKDHTAYLIQIIPKRSLVNDSPWAPTKKDATRDDIRVISAAKVYEISTGQEDAIKNTFHAILKVLTKRHDFSYTAAEIGMLVSLLDKAIN